MNVEANQQAMDELATNFRYNDAVLRNMVIRRDEAITEESTIMKAENEDRRRKAEQPQRPARDESAQDEEVGEDEIAEETE
jgi:small subunit ribosomal protein S6